MLPDMSSNQGSQERESYAQKQGKGSGNIKYENTSNSQGPGSSIQATPGGASIGAGSSLQGSAIQNKSKSKIHKQKGQQLRSGSQYESGQYQGTAAGSNIREQDQLQDRQGAQTNVRKSKKQQLVDQDDEVVNVAEVKKSINGASQDRKNVASSSLNNQKRKSQLDGATSQNVRHSQNVGNSKIGLGSNQVKQSSIKQVKGKQTPLQPMDDADEYQDDDFEDQGNEEEPSPAKRTGDLSKSQKRGGIAPGNQKQKQNDQTDNEQYTSQGNSPAVKYKNQQKQQKLLSHNASKENLQERENRQQNYDNYDTHQMQLRDNPSMQNLPQNHHAAMKRKPPVHKGTRQNNNPNRNMDMYNPSEIHSGNQLPQMNQDQRQRAPQNGNPNQPMAYINTSSQGAKDVGPIGLKRAEKELIMRRYKNNYHQNDNINRVALIYGQQHPQYNSHDRQYIGEQNAHMQNQRGYYIPQGGNGSYNSPYLVSVANDGMQSNQRHGSNNAINIIRRSKNYLDELKNQNSGYQVRLPKITNLNKQNHDYIMNQMRRNAAQQGVLPPLVAGQAIGPGHYNGVGSSNYQQYGYRPSKLRSLNNKQYIGIGGQHGLSGERVKLNHHASQEKLSSYSGNYGSPSIENRGVQDGQNYNFAHQAPSAQINQQYIDQVTHQQQNSRKINGGSKIGTGALNKKQNGPLAAVRAASGQGAARMKEQNINSKAAELTSPSNAKKMNGSQNKAQILQNLRAANNNSNTSTNENSLPPKGHNKITVGGTSD